MTANGSVPSPAPAPTTNSPDTVLDPLAAHGAGDDATPPGGPVVTVVGWLVTLTLLTMIALPIAQTLARFFHADVASAGSITQHLTLWVGFLGAVLATFSHNHLSLSTINLIPAGRARRVVAMSTNAITASITALLAYASFQLILAERGSGDRIAAGIPIWWSELVMPVSLLVITLRFAWRAPSGWLGRVVAVAAVAATLSLGLLSPEAAAHVLWPAVIVLGAGFLLGVPVFAAMAGLTALLYFVHGEAIVSVPTSALQLAKNASLPAVPLLTVAGYVLAAGGASKRLVTAFRALLGWLPGGMALMALVVCALFTTFTGGSGVTILAMGGLVLPLLIEEKYPEGFSIGLVTAAGSLGLLFYPSMPVILYGLVLQSAAPPGTTPPDIKHLFIAGAVPGVLIILLVAAYAVFMGVKSKAPRHRVNRAEAASALRGVAWDLMLPVIVFVTFGLGYATILETAAIAALYTVLVETVVFRNLHPLRDLPKVFASGATLVGAVLLLLGMAFGLNEYLVLQQFPDALLEWVQLHIHSQIGFLLALNVILLLLGSVLEMYSAIVAIAPLVAPLGQAYNVDPIHLGVVFLANLELGFLLPPMGLNLFLAASRFKKPLGEVYKQALPFLAIMSFGVLLVTYLPSLTTGVLKLFHVQ